MQYQNDQQRITKINKSCMIYPTNELMINVMYEITFTFQIILYNILFNVFVKGIIQLNDASAASKLQSLHKWFRDCIVLKY